MCNANDLFNCVVEKTQNRLENNNWQISNDNAFKGLFFALFCVLIWQLTFFDKKLVDV